MGFRQQSRAGRQAGGEDAGLRQLAAELDRAAGRAFGRSPREPRQGDSLLYSSPEDHPLRDRRRRGLSRTAAALRNCETAIAAILFEEKISVLIEDWSERLKEAYETRIFVTGLDD